MGEESGRKSCIVVLLSLYTRTHAHTHVHMHAHTHKHTHTSYIYITNISAPKWGNSNCMGSAIETVPSATNCILMMVSAVEKGKNNGVF